MLAGIENLQRVVQRRGRSIERGGQHDSASAGRRHQFEENVPLARAALRSAQEQVGTAGKNLRRQSIRGGPTIATNLQSGESVAITLGPIWWHSWRRRRKRWQPRTMTRPAPKRPSAPSRATSTAAEESWPKRTSTSSSCSTNWSKSPTRWGLAQKRTTPCTAYRK